MVNLRKVRTFKSVLYENVDDFLFHWKDHSILSFFVILLLLKNNTKSIAGYTIDEALIFYLTFNYIDVVAQMFLRGGVLSGKVRSGEFDFS